ncbi:MAG: phosphopantetheine-binding protein [Patescibacteria group bacterium]
MLPKERVKPILAEKLGLEVTDIDDSNLLVEDLGLSGGTIAEILEVIREKTGVEVPIDEAKEVLTVGELINVVEENTLE